MQIDPLHSIINASVGLLCGKLECLLKRQMDYRIYNAGHSLGTDSTSHIGFNYKVLPNIDLDPYYILSMRIYCSPGKEILSRGNFGITILFHDPYQTHQMKQDIVRIFEDFIDTNRGNLLEFFEYP